jgi:hypothetical protein
MRPSLAEIEQIEKFIFGELRGEKKLLFEANILTRPEMLQNVNVQKRVYQLVRSFFRRKLKYQMESLHQEIFRDPKHRDFQQNILKIFNS